MKAKLQQSEIIVKVKKKSKAEISEKLCDFAMSNLLYSAKNPTVFH